VCIYALFDEHSDRPLNAALLHSGYLISFTFTYYIEPRYYRVISVIQQKDCEMGDVLSGEFKNIAKREHRICMDKCSMG
jgi:hypothetical protein